MIPRILFNDKNLGDSDKNVLGLIISLTLKNGYCFAHNDYLVKYLNLSKRSINYSLANLKKLNYIQVEYEKSRRKIYINKYMIPLKSSSNIANDCNLKSATDCTYKINNKNKYIKNINNYKSDKPYCMDHPEVCVSKNASSKEQAEIEKILEKFK